MQYRLSHPKFGITLFTFTLTGSELPGKGKYNAIISGVGFRNSAACPCDAEEQTMKHIIKQYTKREVCKK